PDRDSPSLHAALPIYAVKFLDMALKLDVEHHLYPLLMEIKYSVTRLDKTLVIVSLEDHVARNFLRMEDIDKRITVNIFSEYPHPDRKSTRLNSSHVKI